MKANLLKAELIKQGYTINDAASWIGVKTSGLYRRLNGEVEITANEIKIIREKLNIDADTTMQIFLN